jgi:release factor glutamine methyltransferase
MYEQWLDRLSQQLPLLPDKPEETHESTLKALWLCACGQNVSAEAAMDADLPALTPEQAEVLEELVLQRLSGKPLSHITGRQRFMGLELLASPEALVPRKETELLARRACELLEALCERNPAPRILDVCTGAGNLPVAMASRIPGVRVHASDLSHSAVALAQRNVALHGLDDRISLHQGDLLEPFDKPEYRRRIDVITCNPPYISTAKVERMPEEISSHEPRMAFDGGAFGVSILERLIRQSPQILKPDGHLIFEVGLGQGERYLRRIEKKSAFREVEPVKDENGDIRAIRASL